MEWLASLDLAAFRFVNSTLANPVLDAVMSFLSGNRLSLPLVIGAVICLLARGGTKGRTFVLTLALALLLGDSLLFNPVKKAVARPRPYVTHLETTRRAGAGGDYKSFPSGHSANIACAAAVAFLFWRRSARFMVPLAFGVGVSRCYNGVHYPSDVIGGWALGTCAGFVGTLAVDTVWKWVGNRCFPLWWARLPSVRREVVTGPSDESPALQQHWLRAGYFLIFGLLLTRLFYLRAGIIELSEDEAYQWLWSKHLALSYYSKPPGIALAQWFGTHLFGDTELGVRFLSPVIAAALGIMVLRFLTRHTDARTGFLTVLVVTATPLLAVGSILITIDPLLVLCWTAAMLSGWRAITEDSTRQWLLTGLWWGGAFLCKYSSPFLWASFALFFLLWPPARAQLRRPGPWLALLVNLLCMIPVVVWNQQHGWITATHISERGGLSSSWQPTLRFFWDFLLVVPGLMNPVFFVATAWACVAFWRNSEWNGDPKPPALLRPPAMLHRYLFCLGAPVFLFFFAYTLRARVQPNWIAPAILPLFLLAALWWRAKHEAGSHWPRRFLVAGLWLGLPLIVLLHETNLVNKATGWNLPDKADPLRRVRGYRELARTVGEQRAKLETDSGKPTFIIADHYGRTGLLSFYLPEAKAAIGSGRPLVTVRSSDAPENQFWFWPEYRYDRRTGENALYVMQADREQPVPEALLGEFKRVESLGLFGAAYRGQVLHRVQLFSCHEKL